MLALLYSPIALQGEHAPVHGEREFEQQSGYPTQRYGAAEPLSVHRETEGTFDLLCTGPVTC